MSRKLSDLTPEMQVKVGVLMQLADEADFDLLIYCTKRTLEEQAVLYAMGRTAPGKIVTWAQPGQSAHNYGLAIDAVPMLHGKPQWKDKALYRQYGELSKEAGLAWAGLWPRRKREYPHAQYPGFNWRELIAKEAA